jgi:hypothetical protein
MEGPSAREPHRMWFAVEAQGLSFTKTAPFLFENEVILDVTPERAFEVVAGGENQRVWFKDFVGFRWTSQAPHGVGAERDVELQMVTVRERFIAWDPGKHLAFTIHAMTLPLVDAMVEDMHFEPVGADRTRFTWRAHYRPKLFMRPVHPIVRLVFSKLFAESTKGLKDYLATHKTRG